MNGKNVYYPSGFCLNGFTSGGRWYRLLDPSVPIYSLQTRQQSTIPFARNIKHLPLRCYGVFVLPQASLWSWADPSSLYVPYTKISAASARGRNSSESAGQWVSVCGNGGARSPAKVANSGENGRICWGLLQTRKGTITRMRALIYQKGNYVNGLPIADALSVCETPGGASMGIKAQG